ncbi:MAG TPA: hypothetical protein VN923_19580 [Thermoanaerobaculia bacterium]|nr:hypothetical protein [Thermoanaerobaculia bacterium]
MSTPFCWATMRVLLAGPFEAAARRWQLLAIVALCAALGLFARAADAGLLRWGSLVAVVGTFFFPAALDVAFGNFNAALLLVGAVWLALGSARSRAATLAGDVLLGLSLAWKPMWMMVPALAFVDGWVGGERRRAIGRAAAVGGGLATGVVVGALYMRDLGAWPAWAAHLGAARYAGPNISPLRLLGALDLAPWPTFAAFVVGVAVAALSPRPLGSLESLGAPARSLRTLRLLALGVLLVLVSAPLVWVHYAVLALPPAALALSRQAAVTRRERVATILALLATANVPKRLGLGSGKPNALLAASGLVVLAVTLAWALCRGRRDRGSSPSLPPGAVADS